MYVHSLLFHTENFSPASDESVTLFNYSEVASVVENNHIDW